jgi:hypothetical protein
VAGVVVAAAAVAVELRVVGAARRAVVVEGAHHPLARPVAAAARTAAAMRAAVRGEAAERELQIGHRPSVSRVVAEDRTAPAMHRVVADLGVGRTPVAEAASAVAPKLAAEVTSAADKIPRVAAGLATAPTVATGAKESQRCLPTDPPLATGRASAAGRTLGAGARASRPYLLTDLTSAVVAAAAVRTSAIGAKSHRCLPTDLPWATGPVSAAGRILAAEAKASRLCLRTDLPLATGRVLGVNRGLAAAPASRPFLPWAREPRLAAALPAGPVSVRAHSLAWVTTGRGPGSR